MDEGVDPQNMCHQLYGAMGILHSLTEKASEDLVLLFQDWLDAAQAECDALIDSSPGIGIGEISRRLGLPEAGIRFLVKRREEK